MALEIEIKMRVNDFAAIVHQLEQLGASRRVRLHEVNVFLDTEQATLRQTDQGLRVRVETDRDTSMLRDVVVTHKGPRQAAVVKSRVETEALVKDAGQAIALLGALGYRETLRFEKHRDRWEWRSCRIELDTLPVLGRFVEIEGPDEATILSVRQSLGLGDFPLEPQGYAAMFGREMQKRGAGFGGDFRF